VYIIPYNESICGSFSNTILIRYIGKFGAPCSLEPRCVFLTLRCSLQRIGHEVLGLVRGNGVFNSSKCTGGIFLKMVPLIR
jgi:hypothetical protein